MTRAMDQGGVEPGWLLASGLKAIGNNIPNIMNQLIFQSHGNLERYRSDSDLILQHFPILRHRFTQSAQRRGALAQVVHEIRNFTMKDTNQIMDQLIQRCRSTVT